MAHPGSRAARAVIRAEIGHGAAELVGDPDRPHGWTLLVDGTAQSHVDLDDPTHLEFEYIRRIGHLIDLCAPPYAPLRALHLGGGAWTLARYVAATRPGSTQTVVELDGPLAEFVAHRLPADGLGIDVAVGDARAALAASGPGSVDLVVLDVFAGARTPAHLTSAQFAALVARTLAPGRHLRRERRRRRSRARRSRAPRWPRPGDAFRHVAVVAPPDVLRGRRFGNLVLAASSARLPVDDLPPRTRRRPVPRAGAGRARPRPVHRGGPHRPHGRARRRCRRRASGAGPARTRRSRGPSRRWPGARRTCPRSTRCRSSRRSRRTSRSRRRARARRRWRPTPRARSASAAGRC